MNMAVAGNTAEKKKNTDSGASGGRGRRQGAGSGGRSTAGSKGASNSKKGASGKGTSRSKGGASGKKNASGKSKSLEEINNYHDYQAFEFGITIFVIAIFSVFLYLSCFQLAGRAGMVVGGIAFGIFGWFAWFLPLFLLVGFTFYVVNQGDRRVFRKIISFAGIVLSLLGLSDVLFGRQIILEYYTINHVMHKEYFECMYLTCEDMVTKGKFNGGLLGRGIGTVFTGLIGRVGATIILFALLLLCLYIFYGVEMMGMLRRRNAYREEISEIYEEIKEDEDYIEPSYKFFSGNRPIVAGPDRLTPQGGGKRPEPRVLPKAPTPKRPEPRELKKVPKVAMFDLQAYEEEHPANVASMSFSEKTSEERKVASAEKGKQTGLQEITDYEEGLEEESLSLEEARQEQIATRELEISQIPIYRNELEQKFGKSRLTPAEDKEDKQGTEAAKKFAAKENVFEIKPSAFAEFEEAAQEYSREAVDKESAGREVQDKGIYLVPSDDDAPSDGDTPSNDDAPSDDDAILDNDAGDSDKPARQKLSLAERLSGQAEASFEDEEVELEEAVQSPLKPMDSFAHKEEVTDVTPSGVNGLAGSEPLSETGSGSVSENTLHKNTAAKASHGKASHEKDSKGKDSHGKNSHGKIGGDDYVSASDTFNALNESKIGMEPDKPYEFPPIDLLSLPQKTSGSVSDYELRGTAMKLRETLESFNVHVKMGAVTCGPTVTRYELLPEQGVRVNKITNLADDLKLSLAAKSIRIEAPIPGKAAVGIEVPNPTASAVFFRELLEGDTFRKSKSAMTFAVGKDIGGKIIMADISRMPHLLIAGATGSGKSVCINTLIMSILYKADPKDVKLIMIDPKVVELSVYNGIPHLFCPVVTDPKEAAAALNWAVREMMDRYNKFKELGVRNISGYNDKVKTVPDAQEAGYAKMPYLVVIVDEFADLMMVASKEVEDAVCRLAQLARAAGIHLVLATQRPSVNVITGVIKANIPSRIAFSVSSVTDSRTILDKGGAEKLLGKGDMLFFPSGYSEPVRVQGAFVTDNEVSDVVEFLRQNNDVPEYNNEVTEVVDDPKEAPASEEKKTDSEYDEYFADAGRFVIESDRAAAGQLQRKFSIGFNRAGRIIDQLHKAGVVGPAEGTKPRRVLMTIEEFEQMVNGAAMPEEGQAMEEAVVTAEEQAYF